MTHPHEEHDMKLHARRILVGAIALFAGVVGVNVTSTTAAPDAVPDAEFKTLVEQDAKNINTMLNDGKPAKKTADRSIKSSALMIAAYAQSRIGKGGNDEAMAALRDSALKVAETGGKKKYAEAVAPSKALTANPTGKGDVKPVDLVKATGVDIEELMYQFKKTAVGGLGIEEQIKANSKKATVKPEEAAAIARRVLIVGDFCDVVEPNGGFGAGPKAKANWVKANKDMKDAAAALQTAAKSSNAKDMQAAFLKIDGACVNCHNNFK